MNTEGFLTALAVQTKSKETMRAYSQTLARFEAFLHEKNLRVTQVERSTIDDFIDYLTEHKGRTQSDGLAPATVARHLAVLSSYYDYLADISDGKIKNPVERVKRPKVSNDLPRAVDSLTLSTLMDGITELRDRAMILTFVYSGLRLSELSQLNMDSIISKPYTLSDGSTEYFGHGQVVGQGNKRREFVVGPKALKALAEYINACRRNDQHSALFLSSRRKRISPRTIQEVIDRWCKRLNLSHVHIHQLRHSYATRNVNAGMSLPVLQSLLGHSNPNTTGRYFRVQTDRKTREYLSVMEYLGDTSSA